MKERPIIMPVEPPEKRAERIQRIAAFLSRLPADKAWELLPRPFKRTRTERQNNAMWGVAYKTLSDYTGYSEPEIHELMLRGHFGEIEDEALGMKRTSARAARPPRTNAASVTFSRVRPCPSSTNLLCGRRPRLAATSRTRTRSFERGPHDLPLSSAAEPVEGRDLCPLRYRAPVRHPCSLHRCAPGEPMAVGSVSRYTIS